MKNNFTLLIIMFLLVNQVKPLDFPVRQSSNWEGDSDIAYNSTDHEYLIVWSEKTKLGNFYLAGPILGQRLNENGELIGSTFTIFNFGANPSVAYDSKRNEFLAVACFNKIMNGQLISSSGSLNESSWDLSIGNRTILSQIIYNHISEEYLIISVDLIEDPISSGFYKAQFYTTRIYKNGIVSIKYRS